jgi:hypothetical protein
LSAIRQAPRTLITAKRIVGLTGTRAELAFLRMDLYAGRAKLSRADSAFGARFYTSYLEGSMIAVTGSVCRPVHNHTDTQWLFDNSG